MDVPHFPKMNIFCIDLSANNFVVIVSYRIRVYHHTPSLPICLYQFAESVQVSLVAQDVLDGGEAVCDLLCNNRVWRFLIFTRDTPYSINLFRISFHVSPPSAGRAT